MIRALALAAGFTLLASAAQAQACLTLSDGFGSTTVTCPDGRTGLLHTDPLGGITGMIGNQPFSGTAAGIVPAGGVGAAYLVAPPPPSLNPPEPQPPPTAAPLEPLTPPADLTQLQREYQAEQQSLRLRRAEAERAKQADQPAKP
jgi:hypothetical protein